MDRLTADWRDLLALASGIAIVLGVTIIAGMGAGLIVAGILGLIVAVGAAALSRRTE